MFKNLHTGTKLFILCGLFIVSLGVATYGLVSEKQIAIDFARKELVGNRYLGAIGEVYGALLADAPGHRSTGPPPSRAQLMQSLASAEANFGRAMHTAELESTLASALAEPGSDKRATDDQVRDLLTKARSLGVRIGDESNLTLDPDLDTYYLQDIVVTKIPTLIGQLTELQSLLGRGGAVDLPASTRGVRALVVAGLLRSTLDEIRRNLTTAYNGNHDGGLRPAVDTAFAAMLAASTSYLDLFRASLTGDQAKAIEVAAIDRPNQDALRLTIDALTAAQSELDRLLHQRINSLVGRLDASLGLLGALACLCVLFAVMTYQHIAQPLERFERVVKKVHETRNYSLRVASNSKDEIGKVASAFNDMLSELAAVRAQESADHLELGRVTRITTMGGMTASLAHEINQPLAAIGANANASLRWLDRATPEVDEARAALRQIVGDVQRTSQVIESVRSIFKRDHHKRALIDMNDLLRDVERLAHGKLRSQRITVKLELADDLPQVMADRVQLQQVILNLVTNAIDAMGTIRERPRRLTVTSELQQPHDVLVTVRDTGTGIAADDMNRIFDAFFTTKSNGMGLGLFICRSILEAHGGRLWASAGDPHGSVFHVVVPSAASLPAA
jgi:signal transduction histidine kinase